MDWATLGRPPNIPCASALSGPSRGLFPPLLESVSKLASDESEPESEPLPLPLTSLDAREITSLLTFLRFIKASVPIPGIPIDRPGIWNDGREKSLERSSMISSSSSVWILIEGPFMEDMMMVQASIFLCLLIFLTSFYASGHDFTESILHLFFLLYQLIA
jgi:hypothetical protein